MSGIIGSSSLGLMDGVDDAHHLAADFWINAALEALSPSSSRCDVVIDGLEQ